jgi:membrane associated rhomboid family serine protease
MKEAPVGFQCPECVKEGQKGARAARTTFGGTARPDDTPVITYALIALNVLVFVVAAASSDALGGTLTPLHRRFANLATALPWPNGDGSVTVYQGVSGGEYYRLITAMFFHFGVAHIAFNMLALFSLGPRLEQLFGRARFLALYFGAGFCGNVTSYLLAPPNTVSVGASTALFGLFGAYFVLAKRLRADTTQIAGLIAINLVLTFAIPQIDWRGHVGGLVGGAAVAAVMAYAPRGRHQRVIQWGGTAAVAVIALVVAVLRTAALS